MWCGHGDGENGGLGWVGRCRCVIVFEVVGRRWNSLDLGFIFFNGQVRLISSDDPFTVILLFGSKCL